MVGEGWPDLVLAEDVSKLYRNPRRIYEFVQDCIDQEVRVIAPGDVTHSMIEKRLVATK